MNCVFRRWYWAVVCLAALIGLSGHRSLVAQDPALQDDLGLWEPAKRAPAAAAQLVGMGNQPFSAFAMRERGLNWLVWGEDGFINSVAPPLNPELLKDVKDGQWPPKIAAQLKREIPASDWAWYQLYADALVNSLDTPIEAFKKSGEENKHLTLAHLMTTPTKYRGKVVPVKGRLKMLRREEPVIAAKERGVKDVYVGWVFGETKHSPPFCIQFPNLPPGLEPSEKMDQEVAFYGYFLATFRYEGAPDGDKPRILTTPLIIGPTVVVSHRPAVATEAETPMALVILGAAMSFMLFLTVVFFLMYFVLQRGDRRVLSTLDEIKRKNLPNQFETDADPELTGTRTNPATAQLITNMQPGTRLPEAKPIDPERN